MSALEDKAFAEKIIERGLEKDNLELVALGVRALAGGNGSAPPVRELGAMRQVPNAGATLGGMNLGWAAFADDVEYVAELKWPHNIRVFDQMCTDSQLSGLYRAMTYPIRRFQFLIEPNGARPLIVNDIAQDMNLDIAGQEPKPRGRRKQRFSFDDFLFHALLGLRYGHMPFEQVGEIIPAAFYPGGQRWALRHLYPRMPRTLSQINVGQDGGLISIRQNIIRAENVVGIKGYAGPEIPIDQLLWFAWEKEGPNWTGRSIFRDCYKNYLIKDRLMRVDAVNHERAGGIHVATAPQGASPAEIERLNQMAQSAVVSESGGGAVPFGAQYDIKKIGSGTDVINSIKYHDEAMARLFLHMFLQLGSTETGSRALGQTFVEYAFIAQRAVATWFCDVVNEHLFEDWVDWNWGTDEPAPLLTFVVKEEDERIATIDLVALIEAGAITVDDELEATLRERYKLPPVDPATARQYSQAAPVGASAIEIELARRQIINSYDMAARMEMARAKERGETPSPRLLSRMLGRG